MTDPNMAEFYKRVDRIERGSARGYGFEANGTLGRSYYLRPRRGRFALLKPLIVIVLSGLILKGAIHQQIGPATYQARVDALAAGDAFDRAGAVLMQADPVTEAISTRLRDVLALIR